jgi:hypothetical protein
MLFVVVVTDSTIAYAVATLKSKKPTDECGVIILYFSYLKNWAFAAHDIHKYLMKCMY